MKRDASSFALTFTALLGQITAILAMAAATRDGIAYCSPERNEMYSQFSRCRMGEAGPIPLFCYRLQNQLPFRHKLYGFILLQHFIYREKRLALAGFDVNYL